MGLNWMLWYVYGILMGYMMVTRPGKRLHNELEHPPIF